MIPGKNISDTINIHFQNLLNDEKYKNEIEKNKQTKEKIKKYNYIYMSNNPTKINNLEDFFNVKTNKKKNNVFDGSPFYNE